MKRIAFYFSFVVLAVVLASCRNDGKSIITPVSSGRPYEVMVVADGNVRSESHVSVLRILTV